MAVIAFLSDFEQGHLFPTFGLARALAERGHEIHYVGIADIETEVVDQGFDFSRIFEEIYPLGEPARIRSRSARLATSGRDDVVMFADHQGPILDGALDPVFARLAPDLLIASFFLSLETLLILQRYRLPTALFTTFYRAPELTPSRFAAQAVMNLDARTSYRLYQLAVAEGASARSVPELMAPLDELPELLAAPPALDLPGIDRGPNVRYVGTGVAADRPTSGSELAGIPEGRRLVYVSLGSQVEVYPRRANELYGKIFELIRATDDEWHFVVSLSDGLNRDSLGEPAANASVAPWWPQLEVLSRASVMITHGGLGTIKECVLAGVPMVAVPLGRDQPANAERVAHHRLGVRLDPDGITASELAAAIRQVDDSTEIRDALARKRRVLEAESGMASGVEVVEGILAEAAVERVS
jgi:MGT family glycosyltransferase